VGEAIELANRLLESSQTRSITGRIRSVEATRAVLAAASRIGAFVAPTKSVDAFKSIDAIQRSGMVSASMSEVRFRSDCIVLVGDDRLLDSFPRLPQVLLEQPKSRLLPSPRRIIAMGEFSTAAMAKLRETGSEVCSIRIALDRIPQALFQWSRCNRETQTNSQNSVSRSLAEARYLSFVWSAALLDMPHADLWIERLYQWIEHRNIENRCVGFPLASDYVTFQQVCTWTTGFPGRVHIDGEAFTYDPTLSSAVPGIANRDSTVRDSAVTVQVDELFDKHDIPNDCESPTILIATHFDERSESPRVFIPCAIPGVDHRATFFRVDGTVAVEAFDKTPAEEKVTLLSVAAILARLGVSSSC